MNKINYFLIIVIVLLFLISFLAYPYLPDKVASHWDANGNVNGYSSALFTVLGLPLMTLLLVLFLYYIPELDPLKENIKSFRKYYDGFILMFALFFFYLQLLILLFGLGYYFNFVLFLIPGFFFLFLYLGLILKYTKRNYFIGIRTPWALQSDYNWDKTHLFGSKLFIASSFISLFGLVFQSIAFLFLIVPIIVSAITVFIYSYIIFKNDKKVKAKVFFLPIETRSNNLPKFKALEKAKFWHTGIIYKNKVYETFSNEKYNISEIKERVPELLKQKAVFITASIFPEKLESEIKSGTSCGQFVLRVLGKSNLKGKDKGKYYPDDVYNLLK